MKRVLILILLIVLKTVLKKSYCCMFMVLKVSENSLFSNYNQTIIKHFEDINRT